MKKQIKILVPIDFSNCSNNALAYGLRLADKLEATVEILHVVTPDAVPLDYPSFVAINTDEKIKLSRQLLNKSIKRARKNVSVLLEKFPDVQTDIEIGIPDTKIVEIAQRDDVDFIMMGTQGKNNRWDRLLGSTAADVLKYATCPVFVIPEHAKFREKMMIGYATDFKDADPFEIWKASKILKAVQSEIIVVHLNDKQQNMKEKIEEMNEFFQEQTTNLNIRFYSIFCKNMVKDLNDFIDLHNINMLVMYKPKRSFAERLFFKSFTKQMTLNAKIPLLILKE
ncbi:MAG: universal stress protein [Saprospiraceae bacterium]